jgi:DNA (cytosine-5)-methyltransferase 1
VAGFELGLDPCGVETVLQCEKNRFSQAVLRYHFPDISTVSDVHQVTGRTVDGPIDLVYGGFPCQDVSVGYQVGERGIVGPSSGLWWQFHRIVGEVLPRWMIIENVRNLLYTNEGKDFTIVKESLEQFGYSLAWRVLDAAGFGVAQRRRRLFIVAYLGRPAAAGVVLGVPESLFPVGASRTPRKDVAAFVEECSRGDSPKQTAFFDERNITSNVNRTRVEWGMRCPTLHTLDGHSVIIKEDGITQVRYLTERERERLMGWPDDWTRYGTDEKGDTIEISRAQRVRMTGNGVSSPVVNWIGRRMVTVHRSWRH